MVAKAVKWTNGQRRFSKSVGARYDPVVLEKLMIRSQNIQSWFVGRR